MRWILGSCVTPFAVVVVASVCCVAHAQAGCNPCLSIGGIASVIGEIPRNDGNTQNLRDVVLRVLAQETSTEVDAVEVWLDTVRSSFPATVLSYDFMFRIDVYSDHTRGQQVVNILNLLTEAPVNTPTPFALQVRSAAADHPLLSFLDTHTWLGRITDVAEIPYIISTNITTSPSSGGGSTEGGGGGGGGGGGNGGGGGGGSTTGQWWTRTTAAQEPVTTTPSSQSTSQSLRSTSSSASSSSTSSELSTTPELESKASEESSTGDWLGPLVIIGIGVLVLGVPVLYCVWRHLPPLAVTQVKLGDLPNQLRRLPSSFSALGARAGVYTARTRHVNGSVKATYAWGQQDLEEKPVQEEPKSFRSPKAASPATAPAIRDAEDTGQRRSRHSGQASATLTPSSVQVGVVPPEGEHHSRDRSRSPGAARGRSPSTHKEPWEPLERIPAPPPILISPTADARQLRLAASVNGDDGTHSTSTASGAGSVSLSARNSLRQSRGSSPSTHSPHAHSARGRSPNAGTSSMSASPHAARSRSPHAGTHSMQSRHFLGRDATSKPPGSLP